MEATTVAVVSKIGQGQVRAVFGDLLVANLLPPPPSRNLCFMRNFAKTSSLPEDSWNAKFLPTFARYGIVFVMIVGKGYTVNGEIGL